MNWAVYVLLALQIMTFGIYAAKHGEEHPDYNVFTYILGWAIALTLYYFAGMFN